MPSSNNSIAAEVVAASVGGAVSATALYPLEVLKTKMQAETKKKKKNDTKEKGAQEKENANEETRETTEAQETTTRKDAGASNKDKEEEEEEASSAVSYALRLYDEGGLGVFYSGVETSAFQSAMEKALYFFAYTLLKNMYSFVSGSSQLSTIPNLLLGCAAEWAHLPVTMPLDCWTTKIQTTSSEGPMTLLWQLWQHPEDWYKGIQAYVVLCWKPSIQYTVFEQVKALVLAGRRQRTSSSSSSSNSSLSAMEAFVLGMVSRTVATLVVFPYLRAKVMLQSGGGQSGSIPKMLHQILQRDGPAELYRGIGPELTRGVLSAALMMMIKEKIANLAAAATTSNRRAAATTIRR